MSAEPGKDDWAQHTEELSSKRAEMTSSSSAAMLAVALPLGAGAQPAAIMMDSISICCCHTRHLTLVCTMVQPISWAGGIGDGTLFHAQEATAPYFSS